MLKQAVALEAALDGTYDEAKHGKMWRKSLGPEVITPDYRGSENLCDISRCVQSLIGEADWSWFVRRYTDETIGTIGLHGREGGATDYTAFRVAVMSIVAGHDTPVADRAIGMALAWWCLFCGPAYALYPVGERNQGHYHGGPQIHMLRAGAGLPSLLTPKKIERQDWLWPLRVFLKGAGPSFLDKDDRRELAAFQLTGEWPTGTLATDLSDIWTRNPFLFVRHEGSGFAMMQTASNGNGAPCYAWRWNNAGSERLLIDPANRKMHAGHCSYSEPVISAVNTAQQYGTIKYEGVGPLKWIYEPTPIVV